MKYIKDRVKLIRGIRWSFLFRDCILARWIDILDKGKPSRLLTGNNVLFIKCASSTIEPSRSKRQSRYITEYSRTYSQARRIATRARIKIVVCADLTSFPPPATPGSCSAGMTGMHVARFAHMHRARRCGRCTTAYIDASRLLRREATESPPVGVSSQKHTLGFGARSGLAKNPGALVLPSYVPSARSYRRSTQNSSRVT